MNEQITFMKLKAFWELCVGRREEGVALSPLARAKTPKPFQPLTRDESIVILDDAIEWLRDEIRTTLTTPDCPFKELRLAELEARDQSMNQDFRRLRR